MLCVDRGFIFPACITHRHLNIIMMFKAYLVVCFLATAVNAQSSESEIDLFSYPHDQNGASVNCTSSFVSIKGVDLTSAIIGKRELKHLFLILRDHHHHHHHQHHHYYYYYYYYCNIVVEWFKHLTFKGLGSIPDTALMSFGKVLISI